MQLARHIGGRLAGKRRVSRACSLAARAMTRGTGRKPSPRVPIGVKSRSIDRRCCVPEDRKRRVICSDPVALGVGQLPCNPAHLFILPATVGKRLQLALDVPGIQRSQPRRAGSIAFSPKPMAGETGRLRACASAAQRDKLAGGRQSFVGLIIDRGARVQQKGGDGAKRDPSNSHLDWPTSASRTRFPGSGLMRSMALIASMSFAILVGACKPPPETERSMAMADAARGKQLIQRVGCTSCHSVEGISWPKGRAGPPLGGFAGRALIAGHVPNQPDLLAAYIRNAPAVLPGTSMPAMPVSKRESEDIAAYLYALGN